MQWWPMEALLIQVLLTYECVLTLLCELVSGYTFSYSLNQTQS